MEPLTLDFRPNQGANDDEILAFKTKGPDRISGGMLTPPKPLTESDSYAAVTKRVAGADKDVKTVRKAENQCALILASLKKGAYISPMDALRDFGCFRLAARIHELRMGKHDGTHHNIACDKSQGHAVYYLESDEAQP